MVENELAHAVIGAAIEVHRALGPGLLESTYHQCLKRELDLRGIEYESEAPIAIEYKGEVVDDAYRMDLVINGKIVIELKSVEKLIDLHKAQILTYLKMSRKKLGLLINFNEVVLKNGIKRFVNNL